jgi:ParE toxin of type II toxin-antitoxin system, parDE
VTSRRVAVKITANFDRNLGQIRDFLVDVGAGHAFDSLIERLEQRVIPALERFPDMGAAFAARAPLSRDGFVLFEKMAELAGPEGTVRQLVEGDYLVLYLAREGSVFLLSIRHHRQLSFDFAGHWP